MFGWDIIYCYSWTWQLHHWFRFCAERGTSYVANWLSFRPFGSTEQVWQNRHSNTCLINCPTGCTFLYRVALQRTLGKPLHAMLFVKFCLIILRLTNLWMFHVSLIKLIKFLYVFLHTYWIAHTQICTRILCIYIKLLVLYRHLHIHVYTHICDTRAHIVHFVETRTRNRALPSLTFIFPERLCSFTFIVHMPVLNVHSSSASSTTASCFQPVDPCTGRPGRAPWCQLMKEGGKWAASFTDVSPQFAGLHKSWSYRSGLVVIRMVTRPTVFYRQLGHLCAIYSGLHKSRFSDQLLLDSFKKYTAVMCRCRHKLHILFVDSI